LNPVQMDDSRYFSKKFSNIQVFPHRVSEILLNFETHSNLSLFGLKSTSEK
jgi:hypothetical protein